MSPQTPFRGCERHGTARSERGKQAAEDGKGAEGEFESSKGKRPPTSKGWVFLPRDRRFGLGV